MKKYFSFCIKFLQSLLFFTLMVVWSVVIFTIAIALVWLPYKRIHNIPVIWSDVIMWMLKVIVGIDYKVLGSENIPQSKPFIIAAVHQSAWDTWGMCVVFRTPPVFILKRELMLIPLLNIALKIYGCIPIKRGDKNMMQQIITDAGKELDKKKMVGIFPQGTRAKWEKPINCKSGIWYLYQHFKDIDFIPVSVDSGKYWAKGQFVKQSGTVQVVVHKKLELPHNISKSEFLEKLEHILSSYDKV